MLVSATDQRWLFILVKFKKKGERSNVRLPNGMSPSVIAHAWQSENLNRLPLGQTREEKDSSFRI